jgi:triosephosphate isomerase
MRQKLVAGNWKMHGSLASNQALLDATVGGLNGIQGMECAVCVPFPYLQQAQSRLQRTVIGWGAQNLSPHGQGAYTGEVSASMLVDFGCRWVIVGHSERRTLFGEDDKTVAAKFMAAQGAGILPIFCVGETLQERESGVTAQVVNRQLDAVLDAAGIAAMAKAVIAYEPVWAIGTGRTASPEQAQEVHGLLRARLAAKDPEVARGVRILYGGSVKAGNAAELFAKADIDGGLIGGASLVADEFVAICRAARG